MRSLDLSWERWETMKGFKKVSDSLYFEEIMFEMRNIHLSASLFFSEKRTEIPKQN